MNGWRAQVLLLALTARRLLCSAAEPVTLEELIEWLSEVIIPLDDQTGEYGSSHKITTPCRGGGF
jgi:hypothetical protein